MERQEELERKLKQLTDELMTFLELAEDEVNRLCSCHCKKSCSGCCTCYKAGVRCTSLCGCEGACSTNEGSDDNI